MRRFILLFFSIAMCLSLSAQSGSSFLHVESFELNKGGVFILPEGVKKTDNNGKPWAMVEIVASGFDDKLLSELSTLTSSTLSIGRSGYNSETHTYNMLLSSGVKGRITLKFQGTSLEYQLPHPLDKNRVYKMTLLMRTANLTILAEPADAKVYIDGNEVGGNGYASVDLPMGEHTYSVECPDYQGENNKTIRLEKNEKIIVKLKPLFGLISITSHPAGADVLINGARVGMTPYLMKKIQRGRHNIEVQLNGYEGVSEVVEIEAGDDKTFEYSLMSFRDMLADTTNRFIPNIWLRLSADSLSLNSKPGIDSIYVTTNNIEWGFMEAPNWLSLYKRNNLLFITYMENKVHDTREADIVVYTGDVTRTLHLTQDAGQAVLQSKYNSIIFDADRDSVIRVVETNVVNWKITTSDDWIEAYEIADTLVVKCKENMLPIPRTGAVSIQAFDKFVKFDVSQKAHVTKVEIGREDIMVEPDGGTIVIPSGVVEEEWSCTSDFNWLIVTRDGSDIIIDMTDNFGQDRRGFFVLATGTKTYKVFVYQKGAANDSPCIVIDSKPSWCRVYVDGKKAGRTPVMVMADDSVHGVRIGRETRYHVFNKNNGAVMFNTGMRYLQLTMSGETVGVRSGFIGGKRWGGYNHFQLNLDNWDFKPKSEKSPLYVMSLGPSYEVMPWMSVYAGAGVAVSNDTAVHQPVPKEITFGLELEAGLMFYYRNVFATAGLQMNRIGSDKQKVDFSVGLGAYFNRYYDAKYGYCATRSREWWSLNIIFNPVRSGYGFMFSDVGRGNLRWYFKSITEFGDYWYQNEEDPAAEPVKRTAIDPALSLGFVFNLMPGYIDFMVGGGYQMTLKETFAAKGAQAEVGFVMNMWRFPLTVMMRCCELEKDTRYLTVDFGLGFSFGDIIYKKYRQ